LKISNPYAICDFNVTLTFQELYFLCIKISEEISIIFFECEEDREVTFLTTQ